MPITINGTQFQGFIDYDRSLLRAASDDVWIAWLEYRVYLVLIDPLDEVFPHNAPHHGVVNAGDKTFFLAGVTLICCAIEGLGHFKTGNSKEGLSFLAWLQHYMPKWNTSVGGRSLPDWLWKDARNGLAHQLGFKSGGIQAVGSAVATTLPDSQIEMDPDKFYADFKSGVAQFFADLRTDAALRTTFGTRFKDTFLA